MTLALSGKGPPSLLQASCGWGEPETEHFNWIFEPTKAVSVFLNSPGGVSSAKKWKKIFKIQFNQNFFSDNLSIEYECLNAYT